VTQGQLVAAVLAEFDADQAQVEGWANERHRRMVGESLWRGVEKPVGVTVAEQDAYPVDVDMLNLRLLSVNGVTYGQVSPEQMWSVVSGDGWLCGDGVFSQSYDAAGVAQVKLWPVPSTDGLVIQGLMAFEPPDLGTNDSPIFPSHLHSYWRDGVYADAYEIVGVRQDLAQIHEGRFERGIEMLARLKVSRLGGGPVQARIAGA
jgi:hypothetical protein